MRILFSTAAFTLLEARRSALPVIVALAMAGALALGAFLEAAALAEAQALQLALAAALLRLVAAFLLAAHVAASVARDHADKTLDLALAAPASRSIHYLGRLFGFCATGVLVALALALPLLAFGEAARVALWAASLAVETMLVCAIALFFTMTLGQPLPGLAATLGLYLLARTMPAIAAIAGGPLAGDSTAGSMLAWLAGAVSSLLPRLDLVARSDWLVHGLQAAPLALAHLSVLAFAALATAAGLFDFHRREL